MEESYSVEGGAASKGRQYTITMRFANPDHYPPAAKLTYKEVYHIKSLPFSFLCMIHLKGEQNVWGLASA